MKIKSIDIQNFMEHFMWRTKTDFVNEIGEESFDIEVAKKVSGTLACLTGAGVAYNLGDTEIKGAFKITKTT